MQCSGECFHVGDGSNDCLITTISCTAVEAQSESRVIRDCGKGRVIRHHGKVKVAY